MDVVFFKSLFSKKKIINKDDKENSKETKKDICFFGPNKDDSLFLRISIHNGESGSRSSFEKLLGKKFENLIFFFLSENVDILNFQKYVE